MELTGPDHMGIYIQPQNGARVVGWSFHQAPLRLNFKPPYYIYFSYGVNSDALKFWVELEVSLCSVLFSQLALKFIIFILCRNPMAIGGHLHSN